MEQSSLGDHNSVSRRKNDEWEEAESLAAHSWAWLGEHIQVPASLPTHSPKEKSCIMKKEGGEGLKEIWKLGHSALFKLAAIWTWHLNCQDYIPAMRREFDARKHQGCCSSALWDAVESGCCGVFTVLGAFAQLSFFLNTPWLYHIVQWKYSRMFQRCDNN